MERAMMSQKLGHLLVVALILGWSGLTGCSGVVGVSGEPTKGDPERNGRAIAGRSEVGGAEPVVVPSVGNLTGTADAEGGHSALQTRATASAESSDEGAGSGPGGKHAQGEVDQTASDPRAPHIGTTADSSGEASAEVRTWKGRRRPSWAKSSAGAQEPVVWIPDEVISTLNKAWGGTTPRIAVLEFPSLTGELPALGRFMTEKLITDLVQNDSCNVVERLSIDAILKEQRLGTTGLIDSSTVKRVGGILGADYLITGSITDIGDAYRVNLRVLAVENARIATASQWSITKNTQSIFLWRNKQ